MPRTVFGWSLPPGVTDRMIDDAAGSDEPENRDQIAEEWREYTKGTLDLSGLEMLEALRLAETLVSEIKDFIERWDAALTE